MNKAKKALDASGEAKATAEGELSVTSADLAEDEKTLATLHADCMKGAEDFEAETKSRGEELKALATAKKVIVEATAGAADQSYSFLQVSRAKLSSGADLANFEAVRLVRDLAHKQNAPALAQLATRMASAIRATTRSGEDPFAKVKGLISSMVEKLEAEAASDASQKAYCDKELAESTAKKDEKTAEISKLSTKIDQMTSASATLKEEIAATQKALSELAGAQAEMDSIRSEEKALFTKSKADTELGLEGVKKALAVLREYYAKSDKAHTAAAGAGESIIGLLEVVESDFSKGLAETVAEETAAASAYDVESKENEIEKASKEQDVKYKTKEAADLDKAVAGASSDKSGVQAELDAVLEYLESLKKQCIAVPETYAERKARREAEIAGLKEALDVLENETALFQRRSRRALRGNRGGHRLAA